MPAVRSNIGIHWVENLRSPGQTSDLYFWSIDDSSMLQGGFAKNPYQIPIIKEVGKGSSSLSEDYFEVIPPSATPTSLQQVRVRVVGNSDGRQPSTEYLATLRRRKARAIQTAVSDLEPHTAKSDFTSYTFAVLDKIKEALATIADADNEGYSREILRRLRETFMNGGWEQYRLAKSRQVAISILEQVAAATEVSENQLKKATDLLSPHQSTGNVLPDWEDEGYDGDAKEAVQSNQSEEVSD